MLYLLSADFAFSVVKKSKNFKKGRKCKIFDVPHEKQR